MNYYLKSLTEKTVEMWYKDEFQMFWPSDLNPADIVWSMNYAERKPKKDLEGCYENCEYLSKAIGES